MNNNLNNTGFEDLEESTLVNYPSLKILNPLSRAVTELKDGAKPGIFWDGRRSIPHGTYIDVIVIGIEEYTGEFEASNDGSYPKEVARHSKEYYFAHTMGSYPVYNDKGNTLNLGAKHFYLVKMNGYWDPFFFYWLKSNYKYSSKFISLMRDIKPVNSRLNLWDGIWRLSITLARSRNGFTFYTLGRDDKVNAEFVDYTPNSLTSVIQKYREEWEHQIKIKERLKTQEDKSEEILIVSKEDKGIDYGSG